MRRSSIEHSCHYANGECGQSHCSDTRPDGKGAWRRKGRTVACVSPRANSAVQRKSRRPSAVNGERMPGKVAIYATSHVNFNEPGIGHDPLAMPAHDEVLYELVSSDARYGMPLLEQSKLRGCG